MTCSPEKKRKRPVGPLADPTFTRSLHCLFSKMEKGLGEGGIGVVMGGLDVDERVERERGFYC